KDRGRPRACASVFHKNLLSCIVHKHIARRRFLMKLLASVLLLVISLSLIPSKACAQSSTPSPSPAAQAAPQAQTTEYTLPPDKLAKAKALYDLRGKLRIFGTFYGLLILLALLYFGIAAKFRDIAEAVSKYRFVQALIFVALILIVTTILQLPLD